MHARSNASRFTRTAVAFALAFPLAALAADRTSGATLSVSVFSDRYVAVGVPFVDLDALSALVAPTNPSVLQLDGCGAESASALLAAAERFRDSYLELRMLAAVKLYELGRLSSGRAAELAGLSRVEFLLALGRYKVFPFQAELNDLDSQNA